MKKITLFLALAVGVIMSSCSPEPFELDPNYVAVTPGISIYNRASQQNEIAMAPADVAMKLAVLRAECVEQGLEVTAANLIGVNVEKIGNLKNRLFGTNPIIRDLGNGTFTVTYDNSNASNVYFDLYGRNGEFTVNTNDVALEQTTMANAWSVELSTSDPVTLSQYAYPVSIVFTLVDGATEIYCSAEGTYNIKVTDFEAYLDSPIRSDWDGEYRLETEAATLSYTALNETTFTFSGYGAGQSFWAGNESDPTSVAMSYEADDLEMEPHRAIYCRPIGGNETCVLESSNYSTEQYPAPDVEYTWSLNSAEKQIDCTIKYNGTTYSTNKM